MEPLPLQRLAVCSVGLSLDALQLAVDPVEVTLHTRSESLEIPPRPLSERLIPSADRALIVHEEQVLRGSVALTEPLKLLHLDIIFPDQPRVYLDRSREAVQEPLDLEASSLNLLPELLGRILDALEERAVPRRLCLVIEERRGVGPIEALCRSVEGEREEEDERERPPLYQHYNPPVLMTLCC